MEEEETQPVLGERRTTTPPPTSTSTSSSSSSMRVRSSLVLLVAIVVVAAYAVVTEFREEAALVGETPKPVAATATATADTPTPTTLAPTTPPVETAAPTSAAPTHSAAPTTPNPTTPKYTPHPTVISSEAFCEQHPIMRAFEKWRKDVWIPALANPSAHRWLYYLDWMDDWAGGFADRMQGLTAGLLVAMQTGRAFAVEWRVPVELTQVMVDKDDTPWYRAPKFESLPGGDVTRIECRSWYSECAARRRDAVAANARVVGFGANTNWYDQVSGDDAYLSAMADRYGVNREELSRGTRLSQVFACIWRRLFQPTGAALQLWRSLILGKADEPLICVQMRLGQGGGQAWTDSEQFLTLEQVDGIAQRVLDLSRSGRFTGATPRLFVTTDSDLAFQRLLKGVGMPLANYTLQIPSDFPSAVHIAKSSKEVVAKGMAMIVVSLLMLGQCDAGVVTERSGYGRLGLWLRGPLIKDEVQGRFFVAMRDSQVKAGQPPFKDLCDEAPYACV